MKWRICTLGSLEMKNCLLALVYWWQCSQKYVFESNSSLLMNQSMHSSKVHSFRSNTKSEISVLDLTESESWCRFKSSLMSDLFFLFKFSFAFDLKLPKWLYFCGVLFVMKQKRTSRGFPMRYLNNDHLR
jgi:hypothetical protein